MIRLCPLLLVALAACTDPAAKKTSFALYKGGEITTGELESWLRWQRRAEVEPEDSRRIALTEHLSSAALAAGLDREPRVRVELLDQQSQRLARALRRHLSADIHISAGELERALADRAAARPEKKRLWNLFKRVRPGEQRDRVRAGIERLRGRLVAGESFARLAAAESDSQTRFEGGLIGNVDPADVAPGVREVAAGLAAGELSPIIETRDGFTLLYCERLVPGGPIPEAKRRRATTGRLRRERLQEAWAEVEAESQRLLRLERSALAAPDDRVVLRVGELARLTAGELRILLELRRLPLTTSGERLNRVAGSFALQVVAADRARNLGLPRESVIAAALLWTERRILAEAELRHRVEQALPEPPAAELEEYFAANHKRFAQPEAYRLAAIGLEVSFRDFEARYRAGERLAESLSAGTGDFAAAAVERSELVSASSGGELGWLSRRDLAVLGPRVLAAVTRMKPGETSRLVHQPRGSVGVAGSLWIFRLLEHRPARPRDFAAARAEVRAAWRAEKAGELRQAIRGRLAGELEVRVQTVPAQDPQLAK